MSPALFCRSSMVSNSGMMLTSSCGWRPAQQAGFLEQQGEFEQVGNAVGLGDDAVGQCGAP
jgi:hypothetical protein